MTPPFILLTSNIRYANPADGAHAWEHRRAVLSTILKGHGPQLIATQEGREPQLRDLEGLLGDYRLLDRHRRWIPERMYPCLFLRQGDATADGSGDIWLSTTPEVAGSSSFGSAFPRLCTWARLRHRGKLLFVVNCHLDHKSGAAREAQSKVLTQELVKILRPVDHLILMGDFNEGPAGNVRRHIVAALPQLRDPWTLPEETTHHPFAGDYQDGARIDWILVDQRLHVTEMNIIKEQLHGTWPSDHYPVKVSIEV